MENPDYVLKDHVSDDAYRLTNQYKLCKSSIGRESALPPMIEPASLSKVLDAASGSLAWTLDFVNIPVIKEKISKSQIEIYACDLTTAQYPSNEVLEDAKIKTFLHNVTVPFPAEMHGTFDLINMRLMTVALNKERWSLAVRNLRQLLRPNGYLLLFDGPLQYYHPDKPVKSSASPDKFSWLDDFNMTIHRTWVDKNNFVPNLVEYLPILLKSERYVVEQTTPANVPFGVLCRGRPPTLAAFEEFSVEAYVKIFSLAFGGNLSDGTLEGPKGLMTEKDLQDLLQAFRKGLTETGAEWHFAEVVAKRLD